MPVLVTMDQAYQFKLAVGSPIFVSNSPLGGRSLEKGVQEYLDFLTEGLRLVPWNLHYSFWEEYFTGFPSATSVSSPLQGGRIEPAPRAVNPLVRTTSP